MPALAQFCGSCGTTASARSRVPLALRIALPILVAAGAFVTFLPALDAGFVNWDDDKAILKNPHIRGFDWHWDFTQSKVGHYHPLTWISYSIDHAIGAARYDNLPPATQQRYEAGLDPRIFHLHSLLLHAGVAIAFFYLVRLLLRILLPNPPGGRAWLTPLAAFFAAILFACHPLRVENAVWVTERRDVLSAFFLLPCLHCYLRYTLTPRAGGARIAWYLGAVVLLALSLLSKAWGITMPAVMLLLDYHPLRRIGRDAGWLTRRAVIAYLDKLPFVALAVYFAVRAKAAQADQLATMKTLAEWGVADRILQAFYGLFFYTWKTLVPVALTPLRPLPPIRVTDVVNTTPPVVRDIVHHFLYTGLFAAVIVVAFATLVIVLRKRWPAGVVLALIYAGTISPVLGFAQSGPQLVADKYAYIGCLVWPVAAACGLLWLWRRRATVPWARWAAPAATGLTVALCVTYATLAWRQTRIWHDSHALWTHAVRVDPHCVLARSNLGMLERQAGHLEQAIANYEAAIAVDPQDPILLNNYAYALRQYPDRQKEAIEILRRAVSLSPKMPDLHFTLANALIDSGRLDEAIAELHKCIQLDHAQPRPKYHRALGEIYFTRLQEEGRADPELLDKAEAQFKRALTLELKLNPRGPGVVNACYRLGWIAIFRNQRDAAIGYFQRILDIDPDNRGGRSGLKRAQNLTG
ncbi:MAG TPA: tetratricopeptide repeat protein [Phycisphaerae bacterium]|nr:tetratricopeptide repeat protein [Phycisphaerae bacterium]